MLMSVTLLASAVQPAAAQDPSQESRYPAPEPRWTVYAQGGLSWASCVPYENVNAFDWCDWTPAFGLGANYSLTPWMRISADWLYSSYRREQQFSALDDTEVSHRLYGNYKVNYHNFDLHADFNVMNILWKNRSCKWLNIYLGTGVGGMFAYGSEYEMRVSESGSITVDGKSQPLTGDITVNNNSTININSTGTVSTTNKDLDYNRFYIPAIVNVEANIGSRVTVGVKGQMNFILGSTRRTPCHTSYLLATVGYRIGGVTNGKRLKACEADYNDAMERINSLRRDLAQERLRSKKAQEDLGLLTQSYEEKLEAARRDTGEKYLVVLFPNDVSDISEKDVESIKKFLSRIPKTSHFEVTGEASATGTSPHNYQLSEMRLANVLITLGNQGVPANRITVARAIGDSRNNPDSTARRVLIEAKD